MDSKLENGVNTQNEVIATGRRLSAPFEEI